MIIAPRIAHGLLVGLVTLHAPPESRRDTRFCLRGALAGANWTDVLVPGHDVRGDRPTELGSLLAQLPAALLVSELA
jgi:hypothetical protein